MRAFQIVLIDLGARLSCRAWSTTTARRAIPAAIPTTSSTTSARPASGRSPAGAARTARSDGRGAVNPHQLDDYIANECFWRHELAPHERFYKFANKDYLEFAASMGFVGSTEQIVLQLYCEPLQKFRLAARRPRRRAAARARCANA